MLVLGGSEVEALESLLYDLQENFTGMGNQSDESVIATFISGSLFISRDVD